MGAKEIMSQMDSSIWFFFHTGLQAFSICVWKITWWNFIRFIKREKEKDFLYFPKKIFPVCGILIVLKKKRLRRVRLFFLLLKNKPFALFHGYATCPKGQAIYITDAWGWGEGMLLSIRRCIQISATTGGRGSKIS